MRGHIPSETSAFAQARSDAARDWLNMAAFEAILSPSAVQGRTLTQCLQSGSVLGVWIGELKLFLFPPWQLDSTGMPLPVLSEVLSLLRGPYGVSAGDPTSGWEEIEWLIAPHARLCGGSPAQALALHPALVLEAAKQDFSSWSDDARW